MAVAKGIPAWGIASLVLLLGEIGFGEYNLYLYDHTGRPWIPFAVANQICVIVQLAAVACGVVAMRRGSKRWALTVAPALLFAVICYFGDL
jgi:carbon starvation protein CstA